MGALIFVLVLFVLAIVSPWIFPNKTVSNHPKDIEKG
jgi:regulatory protein YycI of two-component signal transduction system YycFG